MSIPLISCLMVTREGRLNQAATAMRHFEAQTYHNKEMVVVVDGSSMYESQLRAEAQRILKSDALFFRPKTKLPIGTLRNLSIRTARGDIFCSWDDDDWYHPDRLLLQSLPILESKAVACYLRDQLRVHLNEKRLYWFDFKQDRCTYNTYLCHKSVKPRFPDSPHSEDGPFRDELFRKYGNRVAVLTDVGYLYAYVYHGANATTYAHHSSMVPNYSHQKSFLLKNKESLIAECSRYFEVQANYDLRDNNDEKVFTASIRRRQS